MQAIGAGLGDDVEDAAARAPEFDAKVAGLHRQLLHRVRDVEWLRDTCIGHVIVFGAVQQLTISAKALAVYRE